jgi:hypothetical protein
VGLPSSLSRKGENSLPPITKERCVHENYSKNLLETYRIGKILKLVLNSFKKMKESKNR